MPAERCLIVNADDFGRSPGINRGVAEAHEHGIVTSASLMVRWPAAPEAAAYARAHPHLSLGLHLDLGEWVWSNETWTASYEVVDAEDLAATENEIQAQIARFIRMTNRKPTHLDSHQHIHRHEPVRCAVTRLADSLAVPLREVSPGATYIGHFYGRTGNNEPFPEGISVENLIDIINQTPPGFTEIGCHPAAEVDFDSYYASERVRELGALCNPRVRTEIIAKGIRLCSFSDLGATLSNDPASEESEGLTDWQRFI